MNAVVLLSLVRKNDGLYAWISNADGDGGASALACMPLAELPVSLYSHRDALLKDWHVIQSNANLASVWQAFWRIFWNTTTDPREPATRTTPPQAVPLASTQATAAHPRAFRGTKFQPPKQSTPSRDLCGWLSEDRLLDTFFLHHDFAALPALDAGGEPMHGECPRTVNGLLAQRSGAAPGQWPVLPGPFRRTVWWLLRGQPLPVLQAWLTFWHQNPDVAPALVAQLCAQSADAHQWATLALTLHPHRQIILLEALVAENAGALPAGALDADTLAILDARASDARFQGYLKSLLANLRRKVSAAYTLAGCTLLDRIDDELALPEIRGLHVVEGCTDVPLVHISRLCAAVGPEREFWALSAWRFCASLPGFDMVLRETAWESLTPDTANHWMAVFSNIVWTLDEEGIQAYWRDFRKVLPLLVANINGLSGPWQSKYVSLIYSFINDWENSATLARSVEHLNGLHLQFCQPPYSSASNGDAILSPMAEHLLPQAWKQLAATPQRVWLMIERATRRDNDAALMARGLDVLAMCWPDFLMRSFEAAPKRLLRTARLLGCLAYDRRIQFLTQTAHSAWFATEWQSLEPKHACDQVFRLCRQTGLQSPISRRLREHLEGRLTLSTIQLARHSRISLARLPGVQLAALDAAIWQVIDAPFNLQTVSRAASHAVRLMAGLTSNRKGMRRFLLAYSQGKRSAYRDHPLNRGWFARHPRIDAAAWGSNPLELEMAGAIVLAQETDPLQVLMLGTYVGSCLGLGGMWSESAVACLLDANKQVIYARNAAGQVLARQLIAIDERDRLVCFPVYPVNADDALVRAFDDYDHSLARTLGIDIYRRAPDACDDYHVELILASDWYDDLVPDRGL